MASANLPSVRLRRAGDERPAAQITGTCRSTHSLLEDVAALRVGAARQRVPDHKCVPRARVYALHRPSCQEAYRVAAILLWHI